MPKLRRHITNIGFKVIIPNKRAIIGSDPGITDCFPIKSRRAPGKGLLLSLDLHVPKSEGTHLARTASVGLSGQVFR